MRNIKFRAKGQTSDKWYYGSYVNMGEDVSYIQNGQVEIYICDAKTLGQFTGLTDKNGIDVYEGDCIPYHFNEKILGVVKYGNYKNPVGISDNHNGHCGFYVDWSDNDWEVKDLHRKDLGYWLCVSKVIGNIHENMELVKL